MSRGTRSKGTRIYRAPNNTTWTAVLAAGTPGSPWVEANCAITVSNPKRFDVQEFDASCLADPTEQPVQELKPGSCGFTAKQVDGSGSGSSSTGTDELKVVADATTPLAWGILYVDGRCCYFSSAVLIPQSEGDAQNTITDEVKHNYMIRGLVVGSWQPAAVP